MSTLTKQLPAPPPVTIHHTGAGGMDVRIGDWTYVHINYDYRHTDNASRAWLAKQIAALIQTGHDYTSLKRQNEELVSELKRFEYSEWSDFKWCCPRCGHVNGTGHISNCPLGQALRNVKG